MDRPTGRRVLRPALLIGAAAAVLLLLAGAGIVVREQSMSTSAGVSRWDDFRRSDGPLAAPALRVLPSGQQWQIGFARGPGYGGVSDLRIARNQLRFDGPGAAYAWTTGDTAPTTATVDFRYEPGTSRASTSSVGLIISPESGPEPIGPDGVAANSVHAGFGVERWSIGIAGDNRLDIIATGRYKLDTDGETDYRATLRRTAPDTIEIHTPDGGTRTVTDPRIEDYWGPSVLVEHFQPAPGFARDARPVITGYAVDETD